MTYNDVKIGEYYKWSNPFNGAEELIFVVGRDPFTGQYVATCLHWVKAAFLSDLDYENMEAL